MTKYNPKLNIIIPETTVKLCLGKLFAIHLPIRTPKRLVEIRASAAPMKITSGLPDWAERIKVASWVLSPNSAKNIGENNENLKDSVLNFPKELKEYLDQKIND